LLKDYGIQKQPKYAVFSFFEGNDLREIRKYLQWKKGGVYNSNGVVSRTFLDRYKIAMQDTVRYLREVISVLVQLGWSAIIGQRTHPDLVSLQIADKEFKTIMFYKNDTRSTEEIIRSVEWKELRNILEAFNSICQKHEITPIVLYIPDAANIYAQYITAESGTNWRNRRHEQVEARANMEEAVTAVAKKLNIAFISLTPSFEAAAREGAMLYYPFDSHWNSQGREIAAAVVSQFLATISHPLQDALLTF
jgi:hypothetical protein